MIVLDTNVVSEFARPAPSSAVVNRVRSFPSSDLFITAITEAEMRLGLAILPRGRKRAEIEAQTELVLQEEFAGRILPFDSQAARVYPAIVHSRRIAGRPISSFDAQIAAIVESRGAVLVTRNVRDFQGCQFAVINPWDTR